MSFYINDVTSEYTSMSQVYDVIEHLISDLEARLDKFSNEVEHT